MMMNLLTLNKTTFQELLDRMDHEQSSVTCNQDSSSSSSSSGIPTSQSLLKKKEMNNKKKIYEFKKEEQTCYPQLQMERCLSKRNDRISNRMTFLYMYLISRCVIITHRD